MNDASGRLCWHAEEDRKSFRSTPELDEGGGAITDVTARKPLQAAYLVQAEGCREIQQLQTA